MKRINEPIRVKTLITKFREAGTLPNNEVDTKEPVSFHWRHKEYIVTYVITVWHENAETWLEEDDSLRHIDESWVYRVQTNDGKTLDLHRNHKGEWTLIWDMTDEFEEN